MKILIREGLLFISATLKYVLLNSFLRDSLLSLFLLVKKCIHL